LQEYHQITANANYDPTTPNIGTYIEELQDGKYKETQIDIAPTYGACLEIVDDFE